MKIQRPLSIAGSQTFEDLRRWTDFSLEAMFDVLNGKIAFNDNMDANILTGTFSAANEEIQLLHNLKRMPIGYLVIRRSASLNVYDGARAWTTTNIYLRGSAAGNITVMVF